MKLRLSVNRKAGAPGYGSDGAGAEVELTLDDDETTLEQISQMTVVWYKMLEESVSAELRRQQAQHPQPVTAPQPAPQQAVPQPLPPRQRQPEPGWDQNSTPISPPPPRGGQDSQNGPPRNGSQLLGWSYKHGLGDALKGLAKNVDRGPIKTWPDDLVQWAYGELCRQGQTAAGGGWGGR